MSSVTGPYSRSLLRFYDLWVHGVSNHLIWRCPTRELTALYDEHVTANHLDAGVGTGFFLDRCRFPVPAPRLVLLDLNQTCLAAAGRRLQRYRPLVRRADVLQPLAGDLDRFDSISMTYLLHTLPGRMGSKQRALDNLTPLLRPGGVLFGATILQGGVDRGFTARRLMAFYNRKQIFSNADDTLDGLTRALGAGFAAHRVWTIGCVALFWARSRD